MRPNPAVENGAPRSDTNKNGEAALSRWSRRKARNSRPANGCVLGVPFLTLRTCRTAELKSTWSQAQVNEFCRPQRMPEGEQDHRSIAVAVPISFGGLHQPLDLVGGEVLASAKLTVRTTLRRGYCSIYGGWSNQPEGSIGHGNPRSARGDCSDKAHFTDSLLEC
jgi:hypothetical protein